MCYGLMRMRSLWHTCLVILLSLAIVSGNAHAELHLLGVHYDSSAETLVREAQPNSPHQEHRQGIDPACCCDCLGCVSAINLTPDLTASLPVFLAAVVRYGEEDSIIAGRVLLPEPDPPRPSLLS